MDIKKYLCLTTPTTVTIGLLVLLFSALSSVRASSKAPVPEKPNEVTDNRWRILTSMQYGRGDPGVVALDNKIYAISGYYSPGYGYPSSQEVYDPQAGTWQPEWIFPVPRSDMVVANVGNNIYAIGGWNLDLGGVLGYNNRYDPDLDTWITMTSMITPVSGAGGVVLSDTIYVIGGYDGITATRAVQIYDTTNDSWSTGTPMTTPRSEGEAVAVDGLIYVIGGTDVISNVEIYNPVANSWTYGTPLPATRYSMASAVRNGLIYILGGTAVLDIGAVENTTLIYDPVAGIWSYGDPMPTARSACAAAVLSDTIYVIGGAGDPDAGIANEGYTFFTPISTTTNIVAVNPEPSLVSQPFNISYQVTTSSEVPTGAVTVTVAQDGATCSGELTNGMGACGITLDTPGIYTITAMYSGDITFTVSSDSITHEVIDKTGLYLPIMINK